MKKENSLGAIKLMRPSLMGGELINLTENLHRLLMIHLLNPLDTHQAQIFKTEHFYQSDPTGFNEGKQISLIKRLLIEVGITPLKLFSQSKFKATLHVPDLLEYASDSEYKNLKEEFDKINLRWMRHNKGERMIASINIQQRKSKKEGALSKDKEYFFIFELF